MPELLHRGHEVTVIDLQWFGNYLEPHPRLKILKGDFRTVRHYNEVIIHLAGVANDPCGELDPKLSWEINALGTAQLLDNAARAGCVTQFIYASSGSVYGTSKETHVTEEVPMVPLSEYNKTKMVAERVCLSYAKDMAVQIVRPATVCGYSPRMRLDVVVNLLTMQAMTNGAITVLGGEQLRPNIHIEDMCGVYLWMLDNPELTGVYNAGFENLTVMEIARKVTGITQKSATIEVKESQDPRSYRMNSGKLLQTGFKPKRFVDDAIMDLLEAMMFKGLRNEDCWYNLKTMPR